MSPDQIKALDDFAKFMDNQRNSHTVEMWNEKVIWNTPDAFQRWLTYYLGQLSSTLIMKPLEP